MKKLVVTDKGIGIAEMPELPSNYVLCPTESHELSGNFFIEKSYESSVNQAIASAPLFEDQERVWAVLLGIDKAVAKSFLEPRDYLQEAKRRMIGNTYPISPDFPEYVEVGVCSENVCCGFGESCQNYHTILRFVDKQEQCPHRYVDCKCEPHFCDWVNKDKQEQRNHLVELMKEDEKHGMYEESQDDWIKGQIENLKRSSFHLSVAEEADTHGSVKYRSENYITLSLAIATVERIVKKLTIKRK